MGFCRNCGTQLNHYQQFCPECGNKVERSKVAPPQNDQTRTSNQPKQPIFKSKKSKIFAVVGVLVLALLASGYFIGRQMTAPTNVVDTFISALKTNDAATVTKMLNEGQMEMEVDETQTKAFFKYVQDHPRVLTSISEGLQNDAKKIEGDALLKNEDETASIVELTQNGSKWLVFDNYSIKIQTYYLDVASDLNEQTDVYINDEKAGTIEDEKTFGPLMPGEYTVKAVYEGDYGKVEQQEKVDTADFASETASIDFKWSNYFIPVASNYEDAVLYVNNQSTKMQIGELDEIGPVPLDGSVKVSVQKKFKDKVRKSDEIPLTDKVARADLAIDYQEPEPEPKPDPKPEPKPAQEPVKVVINNLPPQNQNSGRTEGSYYTEENAVQDAILYHYNSISEDNHRAAYDLFSSERKSKVTYAGWEKGLKNNIQDIVTTLNVTELKENSAKAYIEMTSYDQQSDGKILVQEWKGNWKLVRESDGWKLHSADIKKTASRTE
jgi:uncharacterized membrane protein YvbJ